jgi:hypothetical protein
MARGHAITKADAEQANRIADRLDIGDTGTRSNREKVEMRVTVGEFRMIVRALRWMAQCHELGI